MSTKEKRTYADRREYMIKAVSKRRRKLKTMAIAEAGGSCVICGYNKHQGVLDFHHVNERTKSFGISAAGYSRSWASIQQEMRKCVLVCANCHREISLGLINEKIVNKAHKSLWGKVK
jgi:hypothetical protein